jgi:hypothetical protein
MLTLVADIKGVPPPSSAVAGAFSCPWHRVPVSGHLRAIAKLNPADSWKKCNALHLRRRPKRIEGVSPMIEQDVTLAPVAEFSCVLPPRSGRLKFTPERIEQIRNLVERGTSREDIAALIGVTVGSLAVTCSRLGISLRRPAFNNGIRLLRRDRSLTKQMSTPERPEQKSTTLHTERPASARFVLRMQYKGMERTTEFPLTQEMITQLAFEAGCRNMTVGELIGELIRTTTERDLIHRVLDVS